MKKYPIIFFLVLICMIVWAQDSTMYQGKAGITDVDTEDPGLFVFMMIVLVGFITAIILGIIMVCFFCGLLVILTLTSIISFSVILGIYNRSVVTGVKSAILLGFTAFGGLAGIAGYLLFILFRHMHFQLQYPLLFSILGGVTGGLCAGWLSLVFIRKTYVWIRNFKFDSPS
ncbi:MAG: hypothetical protein ACXVED_21220 [Bacteroidia bacterium]